MTDARHFLGMEERGDPLHWRLEVVPEVTTPGNFLFGGCGLGAALVALETGGRPVRLDERLAQRRCDHALLPLGHMGQGVAHPMHPAALPSRPQYHSPVIGRSRKALTRSSMSWHGLDTWLLLIPVSPIACTNSSTRRV